MAIAALFLVRAFQRGARAGGDDCSVLPDACPNRWVDGASRLTGKLLFGLSSSFLFLAVFLFVLLRIGLGDPMPLYSIVMLAWVIRRNRHYLIDRGWQPREAAVDLLELAEPHGRLQRYSVVYAMAGLILIPILVVVAARADPVEIDPRLYQLLAFLVVSAPVAMVISWRPRIGGVFLVGWCFAGIYVSLIRSILEPSRLTSISFVVSELLVPATLIWYLRETVTSRYPQASQTPPE